MKSYLLIFVFLLGPFEGLLADDFLQKAEKAYDTKKYKEAIQNYEALVKEGYKSQQLFFNLGNAYFRNNEIGKAIYYYELARKLDPNDEDVAINLSKATAKTIDQVDSKENFFINAVKTNVLSSFTTKSWAWITIGCLAGSALLFFVFIVSASVAVKRVSFLVSMLLLVSFVVTYFLGYSALKAKYDNKFAIILSKEVRIMNEPTVSGTSKFSLHEGTKIRVVENNGDWVLIKLDNGNEGWLKITDVGII